MKASQASVQSAALCNAPFNKLPPELLLSISSQAENAAVTIMLLRATCARFAILLASPVDASRVTLQRREELRLAYSALLRERVLFALCEQEKNGQLSSEKLVCSACVKSYESRLFYSYQKKQAPEKRKCKGCETILRVCEHVSVTYEELERRRWRVWCGRPHGAVDLVKDSESDNLTDENYRNEEDAEDSEDDDDFEDDTDSEDDEYYEYNEEDDDDDEEEEEEEEEVGDDEDKCDGGSQHDEEEYIRRFQSENRFPWYFYDPNAVLSTSLRDGEALVSVGPMDGDKVVVMRYEHVLATFLPSKHILQQRIEQGLDTLREGVGICPHLHIPTLKSQLSNPGNWEGSFPCSSSDCETSYSITRRESPAHVAAEEIVLTVLRTLQTSPISSTSAKWLSQHIEPTRPSPSYLHNCSPHCCAERRLFSAPVDELYPNAPVYLRDMWRHCSAYQLGKHRPCCGEGALWPCCEMETPRCGYGTANAVALQQAPDYEVIPQPWYVMKTGRCRGLEDDECDEGEEAEREWLDWRFKESGNREDDGPCLM